MTALQRTVVSICAVLAAAVTLSAQEDTWSVITCDGDTIASCQLHRFAYPYLYVTTALDTPRIHVDSLRIAINNRSSRLLSGAAYGFLVGGALFAALTPAVIRHPRTENYLFGFLGGGIIGSIFGGIGGALEGIDAEYDLTEASREAKIRKIQSLLVSQ